jgi:heme-degrading monooxygenase HmoA
MPLLTPRRVWLVLGGSLVVVAALLPSCTVSTPFGGAGYSKSKGVTLPDAPEYVVVGVTHAALRGRFAGTFREQTLRVLDTMDTHDGAIGHSARFRVLGKEAWTMSVWRDEAALDAFVRSPVHRTAMREGTPAMSSAKFMRFTWPAKDVPPTWAAVLEKLQSVDAVEYAQSPATERP